MNRKRLTLLILLVLLLLALGYAYLASPQQERVTTSREGGAPSRVESRNTERENTVVRTDLLDREIGDFRGVRRDLFGELFPPPKVEKRPPPPPPVVKTPPPVVKPPPVVEVIRKDLARFTFMGYLRKQEQWTIFLKSNSDIFLVQEGDRFGRNDQFHALEITPEQLVIEQAVQGRITIPLVEKQPLVPSSLPSSAGSRPASSEVFIPEEESSVPAEASNNVRPLRSSPFRGRGSLPSIPSSLQTPETQAAPPDNEVTND